MADRVPLMVLFGIASALSLAGDSHAQEEGAVCKPSVPYEFHDFDLPQKDGGRLTGVESKFLYVVTNYDKDGKPRLNMMETRESSGSKSKRTAYFFDARWAKCVYSEVTVNDKETGAVERSVYWNDGRLLFREVRVQDGEPVFQDSKGDTISRERSEEVFQKAQDEWETPTD